MLHDLIYKYIFFCKQYRKRLQSAVRIRIVHWIRPVISKCAKILVSSHLNILAAAMPDVKLNSTVQSATVLKDGVVILMIDASDVIFIIF